MKYVFPAIFTPQGNGVYSVEVVDLPGCHTFGNSLPEALEMAEDAASMWVADAEDRNEPTSVPSEDVVVDAPAFINLVKVDTDKWRRLNDTKSVKKTLSIPGWLDQKAKAANAPFSQILQEGLKEYLGIE